MGDGGGGLGGGGDGGGGERLGGGGEGGGDGGGEGGGDGGGNGGGGGGGDVHRPHVCLQLDLQAQSKLRLGNGQLHGFCYIGLQLARKTALEDSAR